MSSADFRKRKNQIDNNLNDTMDGIDIGYRETSRVKAVVENTGQILDDLDEQFCKQTGLTKMDMTFLFVAIGLQIVRQYLVSNEKCRISANQGDKLMQDALSLAPPKWQDVLTQSVPYDAIQKGVHVSGTTGLSGTTHRYRTLGHDPLLGWVFGTANIMTNSLTKYDFETYQVRNMTIIRHYPLGVAGMLERSVKYAMDEPMLLITAIARQAIHFGSDYFTRQGLPMPMISTVNNELAKDMLTKWNIDMWSITRGAAMAAFINQLIAIIHGLFYEGTTDMDRKLYEVRTRKILSYSNAVAASSNVAVVAITQDMRKLDVGGIAVAIYRLITDAKFIRKVKEEFIFGSYRELIIGNYD